LIDPATSQSGKEGAADGSAESPARAPGVELPGLDTFVLPDNSCWYRSSKLRRWVQLAPNTAGKLLDWKEADELRIRPERLHPIEELVPPRFGSLVAEMAAEPLGALTADEFLSTATAGRKSWAIRDVAVAGAKGLIPGMDKDGKSAVALELAVSLATGTPMWGIERFDVLVSPAPTMLVQTEVDDETQRFRLAQVLAARSESAAPNLIMVPQFQALELDLSLSEEGLSQSRAYVERMVKAAGVQWLILDPLYDLIGDADISDRNMQVPGITKCLTRLQAMGCSVWATTLMGDHSKGVRGIFGSKFLRHWLEGALITRRSSVPGHQEWSDFTITRVARRHDYADIVIRLRGKGIGTFEERTREPKAERNGTTERQEMTRQEAFGLVRESVADDPDLTVRERAQRVGLPKSTVQRLITALKEGDA
jgi:AAA domain